MASKLRGYLDWLGEVLRLAERVPQKRNDMIE